MPSLIRHDLSDPTIPEGMVRIVLGSRYRFIWPVHLGGWQSLGWQLQSTGIEQMPEPRLPELLTEAEPEPALDLEQAPDLEATPELEPASEALPERVLPAAGSELQAAPLAADLQSAPPGADLQSAPPGADLQSAPPGATFQAMTKAQIIEHCSTIYGVELDGSQTKAELVEQATALEGQASTPSASEEPLPDGQLDELLDDPLI
jgi:hypothetical protein